ncbi:TetR family transcriptional regulator [Mycobacterium sp. ACS1612]|uniref:TetR/AcrR family transcriptional regulator n=1 Tax=Mycobacterium sp. ACS1612 TaxID=1834117 RepID=UPI0007FE45EB|nr:TetR/AcrR family transcriptional regulator [Mycobacterium sp. ACS1612]OBF29004.1 TetR family transcriptional regulator [Mycobacterium sp. ACS1612]
MPRPRKFDEGEVIAAARDEFWSRGYAATSVDDLTSATGLGKGSLYGAFGDKHALFMRTLDDYIGTAMDRVRDALRDPRYSAYDRLVRHIRGQVKDINADKMRRGCMMAKSAAELSATDGVVEHAIESAYATWAAELARCIEEAQRDGAIDKKQDPQALATTVLAFMRGQEALHKGGAKPAALKAAAEQMISLLSA